MSKMKVEITDTFGGEANYSWVNRWEKNVPDSITNRKMLKMIRDHFGITCKLRLSYDNSDELRYDFDGQCICMFINFE